MTSRPALARRRRFCRWLPYNFSNEVKPPRQRQLPGEWPKLLRSSDIPKRIATFPCSETACGDNFSRCGKITTYKKRGCRCIPCAATFTSYRQDYYKKNRDTELDRSNQYNADNREERREYKLRYNAENRETLNELARERYWDDPELHRQNAKLRRLADPEGHRAYKRQWRLDNHEAQLERERRWHEENREARNAASRQYAKDNPEWNRRKQHERRVKVQSGEVFQVTDRDWQRMLHRYRYSCYYCGGQTNMTADHVIAVDRGGRHSIGNLIPACKSCNSSKSDKTIMEWRLGRVSPSRARRRKAVPNQRATT